MTSRIAGLSGVDPQSIPLPHGTEVTTRAERLVNGRRLPQGLVGRVVRARDGGFDVLITAVGEVWYERTELAPRRAGQLEFAQRRQSAWQQLLPCTVLTATVGSRAWGLADEASDVDVRGAFALPFSWTVGLVAAPTDLVSADGSQTFWESRKLVQQALRSDPNTLELLFVPSVRATDELGEWILGAREGEGPPTRASCAPRTPTTSCGSFNWRPAGCASARPPSRRRALSAGACWPSSAARSRSTRCCARPRRCRPRSKPPGTKAACPSTPITARPTRC